MTTKKAKRCGAKVKCVKGLSVKLPDKGKMKGRKVYVGYYDDGGWFLIVGHQKTKTKRYEMMIKLSDEAMGVMFHMIASIAIEHQVKMGGYLKGCK